MSKRYKKIYFFLIFLRDFAGKICAGKRVAIKNLEIEEEDALIFYFLKEIVFAEN